jgi:hypothetical protein
MNDGLHAFAVEVCKGDKSAEEFVDLWYRYCHAIDDIVDTMEDGRPTAAPNFIVGTFILAAALYNCAFYRRHADVLYGCVLVVTNMYMDSVEWERSPKSHRRNIANVLRCCGDEMFFLVAMIVGGWAHARSVSLRIREKDFLLQQTGPDDLK